MRVTTRKYCTGVVVHDLRLPEGITLEELPAFAAEHGVPLTAKLLTDVVPSGPNLSNTVVRLSWLEATVS